MHRMGNICLFHRQLADVYRADIRAVQPIHANPKSPTHSWYAYLVIGHSPVCLLYHGNR